MIKVLVLAYEFPPYISVSGLRPLSWAKYAQEFGLDVTVVTRQWTDHTGQVLHYVAPSATNHDLCERKNSYNVIGSPYYPSISNRILLKYGEQKFKWLRKSITAFLEISQYYIPVGTKRQLFLSAKKELKNNKYNYIIATGEPFVLFHYASSLSKEFGIPWIADYRDPWSQNMHHGFVLKHVYKHIERKIIRTAKEITCVSEFVAQNIIEFTSKPATILPNGYDPEVVKKVENIEQNTEVLTIAHAGTIYDWNPYKLFLETVAIFLIENPLVKLKIRFYGLNKIREVTECVSNFPVLGNVVKILPKLPNQILIKELKECNVMLLFNYFSYMGTKIYDYLGVKRNILLCFENGLETDSLKQKYYSIKEPENLSNTLQKDLIAQCNAGYSVKNHTDLPIILEKLNTEFLKHGKIKWRGKMTEQNSRKNQVKRLSLLLKDGSK